MKESIKKVIATLMMLSYSFCILPAAEIKYSLEEGRNRLDHYLEQAKNSVDEATWEEQAEKSLEKALIEWESKNTYQKEVDPQAYENAYEEAKQYFTLEVNKKYAEWMCGHIKENAYLETVSELKVKIRETVNGYNYDTYGIEEAKKLQEEVKQATDSVISEYLNKYEQKYGSVNPELMEYFQNAGLTQAEIQEIYNSSEVKANVTSEAEMLAKSEGSLLVAKFLADTKSLRAEKAGDAAGVIANKIANGAMEESSAAVDTLFAKIETQIESGDVSGAETEDLLSQFKTVFDKGLAVWEEAELEFLSSRSDWEKEAAKTFVEGEETWNKAYKELEAKRSEWEKSIQQKITTLESQIKAKNHEQETKITEILSEYQAILNDDVYKKMQVAQAQVTIYNSLRSGLETVFEGLQALGDSLNNTSKYKGLYSYWKSEDHAAGNVQNITETLLNDVNTFLNTNSELKNDTNVKNFLSWLQQGVTYNNKIKESITALYNLTGNANIADGQYSELQLEICKAQAVEKYWAEELAIAKAVEYYAETNDSTRDTKDKTETDKDNALKAYENAWNAYKTAVDNLSTYQNKVDAATTDLSAAYTDLQAKRDAVNKLQSEYQTLYAQSKGIDEYTVIQQLKTYIANYNISSGNINNYIQDYQKYAYYMIENEEYKSIDQNDADAIKVYTATSSLVNELKAVIDSLEKDSITNYSDFTEALAAKNVNDVYGSQNGIFTPDDNIENYYAQEIETILTALQNIDSTNSVNNAKEYKYYIEQVNKAKALVAVEYMINIENLKLSVVNNSTYNEVFTDFSSALTNYYNQCVTDNVYTDEEKTAYFNLIKELEQVENAFKEKYTSNKDDVTKKAQAYDSTYLKNKYSETKNLIASCIEENKKVKADGSDYSAVIEFCQKLNNLEINASEAEYQYLEAYTTALLNKEAYRLAVSSGLTQSDYETKLEAITKIIEKLEPKVDEGTYTEEEIIQLSKANLEYDLLCTALLNLNNNVNTWVKDLSDNEFLTNQYLSDSDKEQYTEMFNKIDENQLSKLNSVCTAIQNALALKESEWSVFTDEQKSKLSEASNNYIAASNSADGYISKINASSNLFKTLKSAVSQTALNQKMAQVVTAENDYQAQLKIYEDKITALQQASNDYNEAVENANTLYEDAEAARLEKRKTQAVYDWAESIYLASIGQNTDENYITPKEQVSNAQYSYDRAALSVKVLTDVLAGRESEKVTSAEQQKLIDADREYYLAYVMYCKQMENIKDSYDALQKAEVEESAARQSVVSKVKDVKTTNLVTVTVNADGTYSFALSSGNNGSNDEAQKKYWTAEAKSKIEREVIEDEAVTQAEKDVEQWLTKMTSNEAYFQQVILAAMYWLSTYDSSFKNNINELNNFSHNGISNAHDTDGEDYLKSCIRSIPAEAYNALSSAGGLEDVAKCILFRNSNSVFAQNIATIEKNLVEVIAFPRLYSKMEDRKSDWNSYWHIIRLFTSKKVWRDKGRTAISNQGLAMNYLQGAQYNYSTSMGKVTSAVGTLNNKKSSTSSKKTVYNKAVFGTDVKPETKLTTNEIKTYFEKEFVDKKVMDSAQVTSVLSGLKEDDAFEDVLAACDTLLRRYYAQMQNAYADEYDSEYVEATKLSKATTAYNAQINKSLSIDEDTKAELRKYALKAADSTLSIAERKAASDKYDELYATLQTASDKDEVIKLANAAFGKEKWNASNYYLVMSDYYQKYFNTDNLAYSLLNFNQLEDEYWFTANFSGINYKEDVVTRYLSMYEELLSAQTNYKIEQYKISLQSDLGIFEKENSDILSQLTDVVRIAQKEWDKAEEKLNVQYNSWKRDFIKQYDKASEEWQNSLEEFLSDKQEWITQMYLSASSETGYNSLNADEMSKKALAKAKAEKINNVEKVSFDASDYISNLLGETALSSLQNHMDSFGSRLNSNNLLTSIKGESADSTLSFVNTINLMDEVTAMMEKSAAKLAAQNAGLILDENIDNTYARVDQANQSFENNIRSFLSDAGYKWEGNVISRRVLDHAYLFYDTYKTQTVHCYEWYKTTKPELTVTSDMFDGLEDNSIISMMNIATQELSDWTEKVFGVHDGSLDIDGEFDKHIGKAEDKTGEIGKIMTDYQNNEQEMMTGVSELESAPWDRKIAESPVSWLEIPSLRSVVSVAAAVAATVVSAVLSVVSFGTMAAPLAALCAAGIGAAITLGTEITFAAADLAGGYKSWSDVGKQLAISAATSVIGAAGGVAGAAVKGVSGVGGVFLKTGINAATSATSTVAANAIQYAGDWDGFAKSMSSWDTWSGVVTSTAGSFVTNSLNETINLNGMNQNQINTVQTLNGLAGGLTTSALEYGINGETSFNLLNIADLGINAYLNGKYNTNADGTQKYKGQINANKGLVELHLSKDNGVSVGLGTGGTDISWSNLSDSFEGLKHSVKNIQMEYRARSSDVANAATALRMMYGFGDEQQTKTLNEILSGKTVITRGNGEGDAQTTIENGKRTIHFNNYKDKMSVKEEFAMGITLGHEAWRDGIDGNKQEQAIETIEAVIGHTALTGRVMSDSMYKGLMADVINDTSLFETNLNDDIQHYLNTFRTGDFKEFADYVLNNYETSGDFWKLVKKPSGKYSLEYDGYHSLYDEDGNLLIRNEMDEFDPTTGENLGAREGYKSYNSYSASLGMLLGTYTNYMSNKDDYGNHWSDNGNKQLRSTTDNILKGKDIKTLDDMKNKTFSVDANPYLMTYLGIKNGTGITTINLPDNIKLQYVSIRDEYGMAVGSINNFYVPKSPLTNITGIENMIPEGRRLKAAMIKFENGNIDMYGLSTTMPDPEKFGPSYPALADGTYAYSWSLHNPSSTGAYPAGRIYDTRPTSWSQVIGGSTFTRKDENGNTETYSVVVDGFPYSTGTWGTNQESTPGYCYKTDKDGNTVLDENGKPVTESHKTDCINFHHTNYNPFTLTSSSHDAGSDGCQVVHPYTYDQLTANFTFKQDPIYGYYTVTRKFFGDGTGGKNHYTYN